MVMAPQSSPATVTPHVILPAASTSAWSVSMSDPGSAGLSHLWRLEEIHVRRFEPARPGQLQVLHAHQDRYVALAVRHQGRRRIQLQSYGLIRRITCLKARPKSGRAFLCRTYFHQFGHFTRNSEVCPWKVQAFTNILRSIQRSEQFLSFRRQPCPKIVLPAVMPCWVLHL